MHAAPADFEPFWALCVCMQHQHRRPTALSRKSSRRFMVPRGYWLRPLADAAAACHSRVRGAVISTEPVGDERDVIGPSHLSNRFKAALRWRVLDAWLAGVASKMDARHHGLRGDLSSRQFPTQREFQRCISPSRAYSGKTCGPTISCIGLAPWISSTCEIPSRACGDLGFAWRKRPRLTCTRSSYRRRMISQERLLQRRAITSTIRRTG